MFRTVRFFFATMFLLFWTTVIIFNLLLVVPKKPREIVPRVLLIQATLATDEAEITCALMQTINLDLFQLPQGTTVIKLGDIHNAYNFVVISLKNNVVCWGRDFLSGNSLTPTFHTGARIVPETSLGSTNPVQVWIQLLKPKSTAPSINNDA